VGGIVGILGHGSLAELNAMAARMAWRGRPRTWSPTRGVFLGELGSATSSGTQEAPATHDENGNFAFDSASDATPRHEIERALRGRGAAAAADINGFFALAWWDDARRSLKLICDRYAYKSLYVARLPGRVAFATDCKALLALEDFPAQVNREVLQTYLRSRSFPSDKSLLTAAIPIGGAFVWTLARDGTLTREPYWQPAPRSERSPAKKFEAAAVELRGLLQGAMTRQLLGRDRIGIALSGGLDSVAVLAVARNVRPDLHIASYTVGHSREDPEIVRAREAAAHFGTEHRECFLPPERLPRELSRLVWLTEDLTGREEAALQQVLMHEIAGRETAYLAGHGADALFAGMPRHRLLWMRDHSPPPLRGALDELYAYTQYRAVPRSWLGRKMVGLAFKGDLPPLPSVSGASEHHAAPRSASLRSYLRDTVAGKNEGMRFHEPLEALAHTVMVTPFFDAAVAQFALDCPTSYHIDARRQKRILRAALNDLLPREMSHRGKLIQRMKHDTALSDVLDAFATELRLRESLAARRLVAPEYLTALQKRSRTHAYSSERLHILWAMVCAELWLRQFIDERGAAGPELSSDEPGRDAPGSFLFATA
jgi:asparagine synthase (glutamine-hydrolysing)